MKLIASVIGTVVLFVLLLILGESIAEKRPSWKFSKWWRKNVIEKID